MASKIQKLLIDPPIAIARLGAGAGTAMGKPGVCVITRFGRGGFENSNASGKAPSPAPALSEASRPHFEIVQLR